MIGIGVKFGTHHREWPAGKDRLDRQAEVFRDAERELQARIPFAPFQVANGLIIHTYGLRQGLPRKASFNAEQLDAIEERACCTCFIVRAFNV